MYCFFFIVTGFLIFEGVNALPTLKKNDTFEGYLSQKYPKKTVRKTMFNERQSGNENDHLNDNSLESIVLAVNTGVEMFRTSNNSTDFVDKIGKSLLKLATDNANYPVYRSKGEEYDIRPELIKLKDDKPSVVFEINSQTVINVLKDLLRSQMVQDLLDNLSKEAAVVYRSIKNEFEKEEVRKNNLQ